jgi:MFS family permease
MSERRALLRDPEFLKYWTSQTIYGFGLPIAGLAIPIVAVSSLRAGPVEMGYLGAAGTLAFLVVGLPAGVIVDRSRRLPLMVGLNVAGIAVLGLVPIAAALGALRLELLYLVEFLFGCVGVVWQVASQAFLPSLVGRARLVEANSRMQLSYSAGQVAGPGVGGVLIQLVSAPLAIAVSLVGQAIGTLVLVTTRANETPLRRPDGASVVAQVREGLGIVFADPHIRAIMLCGTTHNVFSNGMLVALYILFATRELRVTPAELGLIFAVAGPGSITGSLLAARVPRVLGLGPAIGAMQILTGAARLAMPLAAFAAAAVPPFLTLAAGEFLLAIVRTVFNVNQLSLRQSITPDHQQGRMNASIRFVMWAVAPFGALLGGWLGDRIGLMPTIWIGVAGTTLASLWIFLTPVRSLARAPEPLAT